jgi:hypothetical protein
MEGLPNAGAEAGRLTPNCRVRHLINAGRLGGIYATVRSPRQPGRSSRTSAMCESKARGCPQKARPVARKRCRVVRRPPALIGLFPSSTRCCCGGHRHPPTADGGLPSVRAISNGLAPTIARSATSGWSAMKTPACRRRCGPRSAGAALDLLGSKSARPDELGAL